MYAREQSNSLNLEICIDSIYFRLSGKTDGRTKMILGRHILTEFLPRREENLMKKHFRTGMGSSKRKPTP
jgi:hypothetical protein